nr:hypothetical protein [Desulfamplus magnetovallimortis]
MDDYAADPYILAFERVLDFCDALNEPGAIAQIKVAIFFRLCGFPLVTLPPKESPKRKILDRYIMKWKLDSKRLKKLLAYQNWPESEKKLFDTTMISRLSWLYKMSLAHSNNNQGISQNNQDISQKNESVSQKNKGIVKNNLDIAAHRSSLEKNDDDLYILKNKARKIIETKDNIIPSCSIYLKLAPHTNLIMLARGNSDKSDKNEIEWLLFSQKQGKEINNQNAIPETKLLFTSKHFFQTLGWSMANHLYIRGTTRMEMRSTLKITASLNKKADTDDIYLDLQPWIPLSDAPFASLPFWEKIVVILVMPTVNKKRLTSRTNLLKQQNNQR